MSSTTLPNYLNPELPLENRVNDLISRFTLDEKINLMCQYQDGIERLGVKPYKHGTEAAHGIAWLGEATTFPQPIGLACTWDSELLNKIGSVIGDEARGFFKRNPSVNGLTLWAPTVDMERDPRWGRTEEAYGEDPVLTGKLAAAMTRGIQGMHPFYLKAVATLKHFLGNNNEIDRGECSVSIDPRNLHEYYLKAFEIPFKEGGAQSMMTAYNAVNGVPANLNPDVVRIVKQAWGMNGFVVSDAGDVLGTVNDHKYMDEYKYAVAGSIKNGIDSITDDHNVSKQALRDALAEGLLAENDLDTALRNTFRVRFRLGEFDPDDRNPYAQIDESVICRPEHSKLSLEAARKGIVLLKNERQTLPLKADKLGKVAVIGPLGGIVYRDWYSGSFPYTVTPLEGIRSKLEDKTVLYSGGCDRVKLQAMNTESYVRLSGQNGEVLCANGSAEQAELFEMTDWGWNSHTIIAESNGKYVTTDDKQMNASSNHIWEWFTKEVVHVHSQDEDRVKLTTWNGHAVTVSDSTDGILSVTESKELEAAGTFRKEVVVDGLAGAVEAASNADAAIVFVGNHPLVNGKETIDRPDITLPESQEKLIREVLRANPNTIVVIVGSYPYALNDIAEKVPAILYTSHAGQELGTAVADVLFGDYAPAGRLNMTWYKSVDQLPEFLDYDIIRGGRTYQYFEGDVLYPFGHGLTYSRFVYSDLRLSSDRIGADGHIEISVRVENQGTAGGDEVVQLYVKAEQSRVKRPLKQLQDFRRIHLAPGESTTLSFTVDASQLAFWDVTRERWCVETGGYRVMIGKSSAAIELAAQLYVDGETVPPRDLTTVTRAMNYDDYRHVHMDECVEGGSSVAVLRNGWIRFSDARFARATSLFEVRASSEDGGRIEIRLDGPEGPIAGICNITAAGGSQNWQTLTCAVNGIEGNRDIFLVLHGRMNVSWFRFS
ncbi:glycoside hydrolase family 3 C-terminal domain-containing protein [Paenibacillus tarimensis]